jgi:hypothetical protein
MEKLKLWQQRKKQDQIPSFKSKLAALNGSFEHQYWGISIEADLDFLAWVYCWKSGMNLIHIVHRVAQSIHEYFML